MILKWGIIGPGRIADKFASDLVSMDGHQLVAVASRSRDRAEEFAQAYSVEKAFSGYEELLLDPAVDIVYISTPHHLHAELSIKALHAGKHVLCEKPATVNQQQMLNVQEAARQSGRFYMEALWTRFNPSFTKGLELAEGKLGTIKYIYADFCFQAGTGGSGRLSDPDLAGGALLDIGIYPVFLAYSFLGLPLDIRASSRIGPTGVDTSTSSIFEYSEAEACLHCSLDVESQMDARIYGTEGRIVFKHRWHETGELRFESSKGIENFSFEIPGNGYGFEIEECRSCILSGSTESKKWSISDSVHLIGLLDRIRAKTGLRYPFENPVT